MNNEQRLFDMPPMPAGVDLADVEMIDLSGFQVTRAELFSHSLEPSITLWPSRIKFNMSCLRRFPGVKYIQLLVSPDDRRIVIRPCDQDTPNAVRWAVGGGEKELKNRDMICRVFAGKVFDLMKWDTEYRYRILGKPAVCDGEFCFQFKLTDFELFLNTGTKKNKGYLQDDWQSFFGLPVSQHDDYYKVDLAEGYVTTDKV